MPSQTDFLNLILPEKNEFVDSWHQPVNQNMEDIDSCLKDQYESFVTGSGPRDRLNAGDHEIYDARQPVADGRFAPMASGGPSAGFPGEDLDSGTALRSADFGADSDSPLGSPMKPSVAGHVTGGGANLILGIGDNRVRFTGDSAPAVFNIDGYVFRIREQIDLDYALLAPNVGDFIWFFVERTEASYGATNFRYNQDGGFASKDLRRRQEASNGITAGSVFTSTTAKFTTAVLGKAKPDDSLVIESGNAAGEYVIDAIDVTDTDTKLTIKGIFHEDLSNLPWHIIDRAMPNIGAVVTDGVANGTTLPPYIPGRVYIGNAIRVNAAPPSPVVSFAENGVFDSGWLSVTAAGIAGTPQVKVHNLGVLPTSVEIQVRQGDAFESYQPMVERPFVTKMTTGSFPNPLPGDTSTDTFLVPSMRWHSTNTELTVRLKNASADPALPDALFTDNGGVEHTAGQLRVVVRR